MIGRRSGETNRQRGFALLVVLWSISLLALLVTQMSVIGRSEAQIAANLRANAVAEAAADGAVHAAMFHLMEPPGHGWLPDGALHRVTMADGVADVRIENLNGRIGLNVAPVALLQALLLRLRVEPRQATALAAAIADWRSPNLLPLPHGAKTAEYRAAGRSYAPPNARFLSLEELGLVLGMTPDLLARIAPHVSAQQDSDPDPAAADPVVAQAIADVSGVDPLRASVLDTNRPLLASVVSDALSRGGGRFTRRAVVRIDPSAARDGRAPYQILDWDANDR